MSSEINKIDSTKNMVAFKYFRWASSIRDGGNTKLEEEIEKYETELGSEKDKSGLIGKMLKESPLG